MNPRDAVNPHFLIGAIAMNVELVDAGYQTAQQALDAIRAWLIKSNHFEPIRPMPRFGSTATIVADRDRDISAPAPDRSPQRPESSS